MTVDHSWDSSVGAIRDGLLPGRGQPSPGLDAATPTPFHSVLFHEPDFPIDSVRREPPAFFHDLNLDQVVEVTTADWKDYDLKPFFFTPLTNLDAIAYRQEIMRELEDEGLMRCVASFSSRMRLMQSHLALAQGQGYRYEKERWFLDAAQLYCEAVESLADILRPIELSSRGLRAFRAYLMAYIESGSFQKLATDVRRLISDLSRIRYSLRIKDSRITVLAYQDELDYSVAVEATFEKFRRGAVKDYRVDIPEAGRLDHIEAQVLDAVARLHPAVFSALDEFCVQHAAYSNDTIARFDREVHFYVAYLSFIGTLRRAGLSFCYPRLSDTSKEIESRRAFDLGLASKLVAENAVIVPNDIVLHGLERVVVVSGPNQGGKTTFARTFGQLHYLASLGCAVPGTEARLFLFDRLFTHFERGENFQDLRGKLQDELIRIREILQDATPSSIIIMNELFASTTLKDAAYLGRKVLAAISEKDLLAVCVTFVDELASLDEKTVSVVSSVDPTDPTIRTFRLERRSADGLAYAVAIAEKYRVTSDWLRKRIST
jgi:hypothetical protein